MILAQVLISYLISLCLGVVLIPKLKQFKMKQVERKERPKTHLKKAGTPTMGGLIFIGSFVLTAIGFAFFYGFRHLPNVVLKYIPFILTVLGFGVVGFMDDLKKAITKKGIKPLTKIAGLSVVILAFLLYLVFIHKQETILNIPFTQKSIQLNKFVYIIFNYIVMLATTNAINLTDGVDGLASLVSIFILIALVPIAQKFATNLQPLVLMMIGALTGFLTFNLYPAKVFMGDTGSLFIGGFISAVAIYLNCPLVLLIVAIIPVIETLSVMMQVSYFKLTKGKRIFKMTPIHHHFEESGWSEVKVVTVFTIVTIIAGIIAIKSYGINIF